MGKNKSGKANKANKSDKSDNLARNQDGNVIVNEYGYGRDRGSGEAVSITRDQGGDIVKK